jgi:hypothetical protein
MKNVLYASFVDNYTVTSLQTVKICLLCYLTYTDKTDRSQVFVLSTCCTYRHEGEVAVSGSAMLNHQNGTMATSEGE